MTERPTLQLTGQALEAAKARLADGGRVMKRDGALGRADSEATTVTGASGRDTDGISRDGRITSWKAPKIQIHLRENPCA